MIEKFIMTVKGHGRGCEFLQQSFLGRGDHRMQGRLLPGGRYGFGLGGWLVSGGHEWRFGGYSLGLLPVDPAFPVVNDLEECALARRLGVAEKEITFIVQGVMEKRNASLLGLRFQINQVFMEAKLLVAQQQISRKRIRILRSRPQIILFQLASSLLI